MTIVLARELERSGVRVNAIAPVAATRLLGTVGTGEELADDPTMSPENPAAGAVWLASPLADGITGQVLKIMGGFAQIVENWTPATQAETDDIWTIDVPRQGQGASSSPAAAPACALPHRQDVASGPGHASRRCTSWRWW